MFGGLRLFHVFRSVCQCLPTVRSKFRGGCRQQSSRLAELQYHIGQSFVSRSWRGALIVDPHRIGTNWSLVCLLVDVIPPRACGKLIPVFQGSLGT